MEKFFVIVIESINRRNWGSKKKYTTNLTYLVHCVFLLVPLTGLEPVRMLLRGILSPLCLPIPPQRLKYLITTLVWVLINYITLIYYCQVFLKKILRVFVARNFRNKYDVGNYSDYLYRQIAKNPLSTCTQPKNTV